MLYQLLLYPLQVVDIHQGVVDIHQGAVDIRPEAVDIHPEVVDIHPEVVVAAHGMIPNFLLQFKIENLHDKYSFIRIKRTFIF